MSLATLADLLLRSGVLILLVWLAAAAVQRAGGSAAMRHTLWLLGFAGLILVPLLAALMPRVPLPILPESLAAALPPPAPAAAALAPPAAPAIAAAPAAANVAAPPATLGLGDLMQL